MSSDDRLAVADRDIIPMLYASGEGMAFLEELVERFGPRFGGSPEEQEAAEFIAARLRNFGLAGTVTEPFTCTGWERRETRLRLMAPVEREVACIALPYCPPGEIEGPLVFLGDGDPQAYTDQREKLRGAIAMVTTATPKFYHRALHRGEKLGRALDAGAVGFIWMRGEPGGLPETGSARFNQVCEVPAISVSYEAGMELVRMQRKIPVRLHIHSTNRVRPVTSYNVVGELRGCTRPEEIIVLGAHYDGHDISQAAQDDGAGVAVLLEAARALARHAEVLDRTVRFVAFAQEEMGLIGSSAYVAAHVQERERMAFMLNLDGAGRVGHTNLCLQGWPEAVGFIKEILRDLHEGEIAVGDRIGLYSDMYPFAAAGIPAAYFYSASGSGSGAPRGFGHTAWDTLDKVQGKGLQIDAMRVARLALRLATRESLPLRHKAPAEMGAALTAMGLDAVLRYERRPVPGEA